MASRSGPQIIPRGGSGNATVPPDAPIQPPQSFVDYYPLVVAAISSDNLDLSNKGITYILGGKSGATSSSFGIVQWTVNEADTIGNPVITLSGNALASVNEILSSLVADPVALAADGTLDLSGGTNAAPTGQGITDKATLIAAGWTVTTN